MLGVVAEEELLVAEELAQDLEVALAEGLHLVVGVASESGRSDLLGSLAEERVLECEVQEADGHLGAHHALQVELVPLQDVVGVPGPPVQKDPGEK